jgi:hypothetical protein
VILGVAVVLWIVWVAPYVLQNRRHQFQPAGEFLAEEPATQTSDPRAGMVLNVTAQQEKAMDLRKSPESAPDAAGAATTPAFRIRYGRTAIALVGLLALLCAPISGLMLIFGFGTALLPVSALLTAVGTVFVLRRLAVRDRKAKVDAAFRAAMSAAPRRQDSPVRQPLASAGPARPERPLFDAEAHQPKVKRLTAVELREAALAVAVAAGDTTVRNSAGTALPAETWEPVDVPKPVYVDAAKAERPAPEPLDLPEAPKAVGKPSLKQGAPAATPVVPTTKPLTKAQSALSNLDDVLQRRRA